MRAPYMQIVCHHWKLRCLLVKQNSTDLMSGTSPSLPQQCIIMEAISSTGSNRHVHRIVSIQELRAGSLTSKRRLTKGDIDPRPHTLLQLWQNTDVTNSNMSGSRTIRTDANLYADSLYHYTTAMPLLAHSFSRSARVEECFLKCLTHFSFSPYRLSKRKIIPRRIYADTSALFTIEQILCIIPKRSIINANVQSSLQK